MPDKWYYSSRLKFLPGYAVNAVEGTKPIPGPRAITKQGQTLHLARRGWAKECIRMEEEMDGDDDDADEEWRPRSLISLRVWFSMSEVRRVRTACGQCAAQRGTRLSKTSSCSSCSGNGYNRGAPGGVWTGFRFFFLFFFCLCLHDVCVCLCASHGDGLSFFFLFLFRFV